MSIFFHWINPISSTLTVKHSDDSRKLVQVPYFQQTAQKLTELVLFLEQVAGNFLEKLVCVCVCVCVPFAIHDRVIEQAIASWTTSMLCS